MDLSLKLIFLLFGFICGILLVYYSSSNPKYADDIESITEQQVSRYSRAVGPIVQYCRLNQFYDEEMRRCYNVPGGGRILHVEKGRSCGVNILKSHCTSPVYYHICTSSRSILAQCENNQIFNSQFQRCVSTSRQTQPDDQESWPECTKPGRFSVPNHCSAFYTCNRSGRRLYRSVYKCPRNTGYYADQGICAAMPACQNDDSVDYAICIPDSPDEKLDAPEVSKKAIDEDVERSPETSIEQRTVSVIDPVVEQQAIEDSKLEEKRDTSSEIHDYAASTIPDEIMDNPRVANDEENNNDGMDNTPTQPVTLIPESIEPSYKSYTPIETDESTLSPESTISSPDEADPNLDRSLHIINDEQRESATSQDEVFSKVSTDSSQSHVVIPSSASQTDDASQVESATEAIVYDSAYPTGENQQLDATSLLGISETTQLPIEDVPVLGDASETSAIQASVPTETIQETPEEDKLPSPAELDDASHSVTSAVSPMEYGTNADVDSNVETATPDTFSSINTSPELAEETRMAQNDDSIPVVPLSSNTERVGQDSILSQDTLATTSDVNSDSDSSVSDAISPSGPIADEQHTMESALIEPSTLPENVLADVKSRQPDFADESISSRSLPNVGDSYLAATETTTLIPSDITAPADIATTATVQNLPASSDTDLTGQNDEDAVENTGASLAPLLD